MFIFSMFRFRSYLPTLKGYGLVNVDLSSHLQVSGEKIHAAWKRRNTSKMFPVDNPKPQTIPIWKWHRKEHEKGMIVGSACYIFLSAKTQFTWTLLPICWVCWDHIVAKDWNRTFFLQIFLNKQNKDSHSQWLRLLKYCKSIGQLEAPVMNASGFFDLWRAKIFLELIFWYTDLEVSSTYLTPLQLEAQQE